MNVGGAGTASKPAASAASASLVDAGSCRRPPSRSSRARPASSATRHAPGRLADHTRVDGHAACSSPRLGSVATCSRYGDAHVSFLSLEGERANGHARRQGGDRHRRGQRCRPRRGDQLADHGAKVVVNDLGGSVTGEGSDKRAADEVVDVINKRGGEAVANYDSVTDFDGAKNIIGTAIDAFGRLDMLVNNAGILRDKMMFSMTPEDFDSVVEGAPVRHLQHDAPRVGVLAQRVEGRPPAPRRRSSTRCRAPASRARPARSTTARPRPAIAAMTIIASLELEPLRRARQLHRPRRRHAHGRAGDEDRGEEPRGLHRVRGDEPRQLGARRRVARLRRVAARHRPGAPARRQQPRALPSRGRSASSSSPPTRTATRSSGTRPTSAASSTATSSAASNPGIDAASQR